MAESRPTIAVVDDDPAVRKALARLLRGAGFDVATFASAEEFLARGPSDPPGCLILDISLEGMSGLELREEIVRTGVRVPVIFITAHDNAVTLRGLGEAPGVPCLRKPFDEALLFDGERGRYGQRAANVRRPILATSEPWMDCPGATGIARSPSSSQEEGGVHASFTGSGAVSSTTWRPAISTAAFSTTALPASVALSARS